MMKSKFFNADGSFKKSHPVPTEWRKVVSRTQKGKIESKETRKKKSASHKERWKSPTPAMLDGIKRRSLKRKGQKHSAETKKLISTINKKQIKEGKRKVFGHGIPIPTGTWVGRKHKEESKAKMSISKKALYDKFPEKHPNRRISRISKPQKKLFEMIKQTYPDAELNYKIKGTRRYADVAIPSTKEVWEYDEYYWHKDREECDKKRDKELLGVGWKTIRIKGNHGYFKKAIVREILDNRKKSIPQ